MVRVARRARGILIGKIRGGEIKTNSDGGGGDARHMMPIAQVWAFHLFGLFHLLHGSLKCRLFRSSRIPRIPGLFPALMLNISFSFF